MVSRPRLTEQGGFSLPELMIVMVLGLIILGSATLITAGAARHNTEVASRTEATQRGRLALDRMEQAIRSQVCSTAAAFPVTSAKRDELTFFADLSDGSKPVTRHTLTYDPAAQTLTDTSVVGSTATPQTFTGTAKVERLAEGIERKGASPVFRYYTYPATPPAGSPLQPDVELTPVGTTSLSGTDLGRISRIDLNFLATGSAASTKTDIRAEMTDQVFVRLSDPNSATTFNPSCT